MVKRIGTVILCGFLILGFVSAALADARIDSMSSDPRVTEDLDLIWMYPQRILQYKNTSDFRLNGTAGIFGHGTGEWGGILGDCTDLGLDGVLGTYVNRPFAPSFGVYPIEYWLPTGGTAFWSLTESHLYQAPDAVSVLGATTPSNKLDLFYARTLGGDQAGIKLNYADNQPNNSTNAVTTTADNSLTANNTGNSRVLGIDLGLGMTGSFFSQTNFHAGFSAGSFSSIQSQKNNAGQTTLNDNSTDNGIYTITAGALLQHELGPDSNLRLFGDWSLNQFNTKDKVQQDPNGNFNSLNGTNYTAASDYNLMTATLGLAANKSLDGGKILVTSGLLLSYWNSKETSNETDKPSAVAVSNDYKNEQDVTLWDASWNTGLEAQVADWITLRAGIEKVLFNRTDTKTVTQNPAIATTTVDVTGDSSPLNGVLFSTGFGLNWKTWSLDTLVTAGSWEQSLANVQPGNGIFFDNKLGTGTGAIVTVVEADLRYRF